MSLSTNSQSPTPPTNLDFFSTLFDKDDLVYAGSLTSRATRPVSEVPEMFTEFYSINAFSSPTREDSKITKFRSILVESDTLPIEDQKAVLAESGIPFTAIVHSGNKSLHLLISLEEPCSSRAEYDALVSQVYETLERKFAFKPDKACRNPGRLSRFPNSFRRETGKQQSIVELRSRVPRVALDNWLQAHPAPAPVSKVVPLKAVPKGKLARSSLALLESGNAPDGRNITVHKTARDHLQNGYSQEECEAAILAAPGLIAHDFTEEEALKAIASAYSKPANYPPRLISTFPFTRNVSRNGEIIQKPIFDHPENMRFLLADIMGLTFRLNILKGLVEINGVPIADSHLAAARIKAREMEITSSTEAIQDVMFEMAEKNSYHPVKTHIESAPWNGQDAIGELFKTMTIDPEFAAHTATYERFLRCWLVGVIARTYDQKQNLCLILKAGQGLGKSQWISKLHAGFGQGFSEASIDPSNKDDLARHVQYSVIHLAELDAITSKRDSAALKGYLTHDYVSYRAPYARHSVQGRSALSFIASVNEGKFLNDATGSRRFLVLPITGLDFKHNVDCQQVWAQALHLYKTGYQFWLDLTEIQSVNTMNEEFTETNWVNALADLIEPGTIEASAAELFASYGEPKFTAAQAKALGHALGVKGVKKRRVGTAKVTKYLVKEIPRALV